MYETQTITAADWPRRVELEVKFARAVMPSTREREQEYLEGAMRSRAEAWEKLCARGLSASPMDLFTYHYWSGFVVAQIELLLMMDR